MTNATFPMSLSLSRRARLRAKVYPLRATLNRIIRSGLMVARKPYDRSAVTIARRHVVQRLGRERIDDLGRHGWLALHWPVLEALVDHVAPKPQEGFWRRLARRTGFAD